jgi:hypothetical protein
MKNPSVTWSAGFAGLLIRYWRTLGLLALWCAVLVPAPEVKAALPGHNVAAANIDVAQVDAGNAATSVIVTITNLPINDFRIRTNSNRGDFNIQIGDDFSDDYTSGILMTSVTQNGRNNEGAGDTGDFRGTIYPASFMMPAANGYFICVNTIGTNGAGGNGEFNINVAGAWFPFTNWLGAYAFPASLANGSATVTNDTIIGSPQLVYGTHYQDKQSGAGANAGKSIVDLTSLGIDSRVDGVLIVNGAKNESANYALSQVNTNNGTWNLFLRDTGSTVNGENDPIAFVFIPKTNTTVVSGRFRGDASILMYSGGSPGFTVTSNDIGTYELKIPGRKPSNGVLIVSPEGGPTSATNFDNVVSYQANANDDGWIIQSRDCPAVATVTSITAPLDRIPALEPVCTFVYLPGPTPGITVTPTNGLVTSENSGFASFNVTLDTPPTDDVTIPVSSSNTAEGTVSTNSLVFSPSTWNLPQTVTITGQDDLVTDGTVAYTIILGAATSTDLNYNAVNPADVAVVNTDNEGGITVAPTSGLTTTEAGGQATFNIHLNSQPGANVTINLSSSNTGEGTVSPSSVTFDTVNWATDQPVTVTGVNDFVDDGDITYTIVTAPSISADLSYNGINPADVTVTNIDNDTAGLAVSAALNGVQVVESKTNTYTVALLTQPTANVQVNISSSNPSQGGTASPSILTFTSVNWSNAQTVSVVGADDIILDGSTVWTLTNSVSSSDPVYATVAPVTVPATTYDNEAVLTLPSVGETLYGIGQAGVGIDGRASIVDTNSTSYPSGTLTITLTTNGTSSDRLEFRNTGTGPGQVGVSGNNVSYGGTTIGTFAGGVGTTPLVVTFNASSSPTSAEAVLRNVTFRNTNASPSVATRAVSVALGRADGYVVSAPTTVRVGLLRYADFQEGADHGYGLFSGVADCQLRQADPATPYPAGSGGGLFIDYPLPGEFNAFHTLMRFDNIFGDGFGQIPTNAVIVAADLILRIPPEDSNSMGDGSPLYRMLIPFNENTETWDSMGNGVDQDNIESMSTFDSAFGLSNGDANTSTGTISFSVRPDIDAWRAGQANFGWVMPGWVGNGDGTTVSPSEAVTISDRPRLRVLWLPPVVTNAFFRQNVDNYTNAMDTRIRLNAPDTEFSTVTGVFVDYQVTGSTQNEEQVMIRFDNIIGIETNQIPFGATIHAAMLDLGATIGNAMGDGGTFHAMLQSWWDTNTWNQLNNGISADDVEAVAANSAVAGNPSLNPNVQAGFLEYELTADVQAWVSGTRPNYGWVILPWPNGGDGWGFATAEAATERDRPRLRVYYTANATVGPIVIQNIQRTPSTAVITFSGSVGTQYTILRSGTVNGNYTPAGTATVQPGGTGTFTDNAPLPGAAFYRISYP